MDGALSVVGIVIVCTFSLTHHKHDQVLHIIQSHAILIISTCAIYHTNFVPLQD